MLQPNIQGFVIGEVRSRITETDQFSSASFLRIPASYLYFLDHNAIPFDLPILDHQRIENRRNCGFEDFRNLFLLSIQFKRAQWLPVDFRIVLIELTGKFFFNHQWDSHMGEPLFVFTFRYYNLSHFQMGIAFKDWIEQFKKLESIHILNFGFEIHMHSAL